MQGEAQDGSETGVASLPVRRWCARALIGTCFVVATWLSWRRWPDISVDYGGQLYLPWQLVGGRVMYRDLAYMHGPLSQHVHALLFALFGPGLLVLALFNLLVTATATWLVHRLLGALADGVVATVGAVLFLFVFAFGHLVGLGNYNFVTPYSHEITHGAVLALASIWLVHRHHVVGGRWRLLLGGSLFGLVLLTKVEVVVAAGAASAVGFLAGAWSERRLGHRALAEVAAFALAALATVAAALLLLAWHSGAFWALQSVVLPWRYVLGGSASGLRFFKTTLGTADLAANLGRMAWAALGVAALAALGASAACVRRSPRRRWPFELALFLAFAAGILALPVPLLAFASALPLVVLVVLALALVWPRTDERGVEPRRRLAVVMSVFALGMMAKVFLNVGVRHYGFVLAMPATLVCLAALGSWLPGWVERRGGWGGLTRAVTLAAAAGVVVHALAGTQAFRTGLVNPIGEGRDQFYVGSRAAFDQRVLGLIQRRVKAGRTLAMIPEGVMFNYLARRENPTPYSSLMPAEWSTYGEPAIVAAFAAHPPDFVGLMHMDTSPYGVRYFGTDYAGGVMEWLLANYEAVIQVGRTPLRPGRGELGFTLLRRVVPEAGRR